jgi:hypothetical protein
MACIGSELPGGYSKAIISLNFHFGFSTHLQYTPVHLVLEDSTPVSSSPAPEEPARPFLRTPTPAWPHRQASSQIPRRPRLLSCLTCLQRPCLPTLRAQAERQAVAGSPRTASVSGAPPPAEANSTVRVSRVGHPSGSAVAASSSGTTPGTSTAVNGSRRLLWSGPGARAGSSAAPTPGTPRTGGPPGPART